MVDQKQTELADAKTQEMPKTVLPDIVPTEREDDEQFSEKQERIEEMIAADAPLSEILSNPGVDD